jgi:hypothetical protein
MTRYDRAIEIRAAALAVIRRIGRIERIGGKNPARVERAELGDLTIMHNGRSNPVPALPGQCPYSVNIWTSGRKVFLVSWDDTDPQMEITTFVKGDWCEALLQESAA